MQQMDEIENLTPLDKSRIIKAKYKVAWLFSFVCNQSTPPSQNGN